jgi:hypothetical protein
VDPPPWWPAAGTTTEPAPNSDASTPSSAITLRAGCGGV